ncbi:hypothetical protein KY495_18825 [Massilia sp. PAMC28688]|nr:hypothetical protein [Massilia sp. PAMC28688]QYF92761.1 hypothetical protein KY495_18825 [Massilia sp. PAMC28688]
MIDGGAVKVPVLSQVWLTMETSALELISVSLADAMPKQRRPLKNA